MAVQRSSMSRPPSRFRGEFMAKLTKRVIDAAEARGETYFLWDGELRGLGLRVAPAGTKSFVLQCRTTFGRSCRLTLGRYGVLTLDQARDLAREKLVAVALGEDPGQARKAQRAAPTLAELLDRYLDEHARVHNAERTVETAESLIRNHIKPQLGSRKVHEIAATDVARLHRSLASTPRTANYCVAILGKAFALAELWRLLPAGANPVAKIKKFEETARERFLTMAELHRLGAALNEAETEGLAWRIRPDAKVKHVAKTLRRTFVRPDVVDILRLLLLTGARLGEILALEWRHVDESEATFALPNRKGGARRRHPANAGAMAIIARRPRVAGSPWVFPRAADPERHISKEVVENAWQRVRHAAGLDDVHIHDLRHTVGTMASQSGANAFIIRDLLRHKTISMTSVYVNWAEDPVRDMAETVGEKIAAGLNGRQIPPARQSGIPQAPTLVARTDRRRLARR